MICPFCGSEVNLLTEECPKCSKTNIIFKDYSPIVDREGKKIAQIKIPLIYEGYSFAISRNIFQFESNSPWKYRIKFLLGNSFINEISIPDSYDFVSGFSNLIFNEFNEAIKCSYNHLKNIDRKDAELKILVREQDRQITGIGILINENNESEALRYSSIIVMQLLDVLSYLKGVPLEIKRIEVFYNSNEIPLTQYLQLPYLSMKEVSLKDIEIAQYLPNRLKGILRILRESMNSSNPFYRCLCLYRLFEGIKKIRILNNQDAKRNGIAIQREKLIVPSNEITQKSFPEYVNKSINKFIDYVRDKARLNIAHFNTDNLSNILLDPSFIGSIHKINLINAVLIDLARMVIRSESKFMQEAQIDK